MKIEAGKNFASRECPSCACEVPGNNNRCPICGYAFPQATTTQLGLRWGGALIMLAILAWALLRGCR